MTRNDYRSMPNPLPSPSRMRYVAAQLRTDADDVLREIAFVLEMTRRVKGEILQEQAEAETVGA